MSLLCLVLAGSLHIRFINDPVHLGRTTCVPWNVLEAWSSAVKLSKLHGGNINQIGFSNVAIFRTALCDM